MPTYLTISGPFRISDTPPRIPGALRWIIGPVEHKEVSSMPVEVNLSTEQRVLLTVAPVTPAGNPAELDTDPVWEVTSGTVTLTAPTPPNPLAMWANGVTAGDGEGVVPISDTALLHVDDPQASSLGMTAGTPELKPST